MPVLSACCFAGFFCPRYVLSRNYGKLEKQDIVFNCVSVSLSSSLASSIAVDLRGSVKLFLLILFSLKEL